MDRTLLLSWIVFFSSTYGAFNDVFGPCCHTGVEWSGASYRCDNYPAPIAIVSDNDQATCLSIIEVCCIKQTNLLSCEAGKVAALDDQICAIRDIEPGAEQFRECCHCCHLGMESRLYAPDCIAPGLGEPCDSKFAECCKGEKSGNLSFTGVPVQPTTNPPTTTANLDFFVETTTLSPVKDDAIVDETNSRTNRDTIYDDDDVDDFGFNDNNGFDEKVDDNIEKENGNDYDEVNECQLFLGQLCSHICVDTKIGFYCDCPDGFRLDPATNRTCMADDTPTQNPITSFDAQRRPSTPRPIDVPYNCFDNNPCQQRCAERPGGTVECRCYDGYKLAADGTSCEDIDECAEGLATCAPEQTCVNTKGRFTCLSSRCPAGYELDITTGRCRAGLEQCAVGYEFNARLGSCQDVNECGLGVDSCGIGERCENTMGSYVCRRERHCGTGYTLDEETQRCLDNDECEMGTHNCFGAYECQNIQGSFRCIPGTCDEGYRFDRMQGRCVAIDCPTGLKANAAGNCVDIDECEERGQSACRRHQRCVNTRGSFYCRNFINCPPGYEPTESRGCQDIDECEQGTHKCGVEQECVNRQGTYFCQCPRGTRHDSAGRCVDVDECSYGAAICPSNSQCVNTIGSFKCDCVDGLVSDGHDSCTDIDECEQQAGICQQSCVNVLGTFFCSCNRGYQLRDDKRSCEDIDECTQFRGRGGRNGVCGGRCVNLPGSYRCECPDGWRLKPDGRSCEDINECREGSAYCPHSESICINTRGGYKCPVVRCPEGYIKTNSSGQRDSIKCRRVTTDCPECRRGLLSRTYNFISFASNVLVPAPLFSMTGSRLVDKYYTWDLDLISARPLRAGMEAADASFFSLEKSRDFARVSLLRQIPGPQDLVLKMTMNVTSYYKGFEGMAESRIYLYITDTDNN